jgi:UDP-3-O-[3-hydroxymyristoyl] glucosamine N-acyltransferase
MTAGQIATLVGGELVGHHDINLAGIAPLERAGPGDLSFLAAPRYLNAFYVTKAAVVLVAPQFRTATPGPVTRIVVPQPLEALRTLIDRVAPRAQSAWGVHPTAAVGRGTRWSERIAIGPHAIIGRRVAIGADCRIHASAVVEDDVTLGDDCVVGTHATLHRGVVLGHRVVVGSGARIGGPGFGFMPTSHGHLRLPQAGSCHIGDDVEIGTNTTIDRGSLGDTEVGAGTKIDNLVQIAHNVRVGARCIIMAQVGVAGSSVVEDDVVLAGQAGLADHLTVGRKARVAAQSGVIGDVAAGATVSGYPARDHRSVLRQAAALGRLAPLVTALERITKRP